MSLRLAMILAVLAAPVLAQARAHAATRDRPTSRRAP